MRKLLIVLAVLLAAYLLTGVSQIRPGERAVVRRFGEVVDVPRPGLYVGLPWGMDRVDRVPADLLRRVPVGYPTDWQDDGQATPPGQLLTGDHNLINLQVEINYTVGPGGEAEQVVQYLLHAERADGLVARAAEAAMTEWVAQRDVDQVLTQGKAQLPPWLVAQVQERIAPYGLGVDIRSASVTHLLPPERVKPAFDEVTRAQTAKATRETRALQEADRLRRSAEMQRVEIEQASAAEVRATLEQARIEAETFTRRCDQYQQLRQQNPDILAGIWWDEMSRIFAGLKEKGRIDLLDKHIGSDGLDISQFVPAGKKK